jgi:hypothetical protein
MGPTIQVTFDCADPDVMMRFWAEVLGYHIPAPPDGFETWDAWLQAEGVPEAEWNSAGALEDPAGERPRIYFQRVPEPKTVKNRVHLDVNVGGKRGTEPEVRRERVDAEIPRLEKLGATKLRVLDDPGEYCVVMQDPEGNEFCIQ